MNLLELAKQGDAKAIAALMNRYLQPKGITARTDLKNGRLQVILESAQVPEQQAMVEFAHKVMSSLRVASIHKVRVCGRQTDLDFTVWVEEINLATAKSSTSPSTSPYPTYCTKSPNQIEDVTPVKKTDSFREKAQPILGLWVLVLVFGGCVHQMGYPWNCGEARLDVQKIKDNADETYRQQMADANTKDLEIVHSMQGYQYELSQAEDKKYRLCKNQE